MAIKKITSDENALIMEGAHVMGDVTFGEGCSVWYGAVLRADCDAIRLGKRCNIQDNAVLHSDEDKPTVLEDYVTVGHSAIVHSAYVGHHTLIGMGAIVLTGARVGSHCIVGAGAIVTSKTVVPDGSLVVGNPARVVRTLTPEEMQSIGEVGDHYYAMARRHQDEAE